MASSIPPTAPPAAEPPERTEPADAPARGPRRRLRLGIAVVAVLLASIAAVAATRDRGADPWVDSVASAAGRTGAEPLATTTSTAAPTTTTTAPEPLPIPEALPVDAWEPTPQVVAGTIDIPKLGVHADLQEGMTLTAINRGPGHWPGTPEPGHLGNMVIAGHRTTYSKPFADLDLLVEGDTVVFTTAEGTFTYEVRGVIVVPAANIGIAAQSRAHTATLFACHPKGSAAYRIVAKLRLLGPDGTPVDPDDALPPLEQGSDPTTDTTLVVKDRTVPTLPGEGL